MKEVSIGQDHFFRFEHIERGRVLLHSSGVRIEWDKVGLTAVERHRTDWEGQDVHLFQDSEGQESPGGFQRTETRRGQKRQINVMKYKNSL